MTSNIETCFNALLIVYTQVFGVFLQSSVTVNSIHNKILDCAPVCHIDAPSCGCPITGMQYQQYVGYLVLYLCHSQVYYASFNGFFVNVPYSFYNS